MKLIPFVLSLVLVAPSFAAGEPIVLNDLQGKPHTPLAAGDRKAVVLFFVSPYCPTSNAFTPEINKIAAEYGDRFACYLIEADADITAADAAKHAEMMEIKAPLLLDPKQQLARHTKATTTAADGAVLYQGRINDLYLAKTKKQKEPKTHDLRNALDAIAKGQPVAVPKTEPIGCSIKVGGG